MLLHFHGFETSLTNLKKVSLKLFSDYFCLVVFFYKNLENVLSGILNINFVSVNTENITNKYIGKRSLGLGVVF